MARKTKTELKEEFAALARHCLSAPVRDLSQPSNQQVKPMFEFAIEKLMREPDARTRLATLELLLAYGIGKPVQQIEAKTENLQKFVAEVPAMLNNADWMERYGNPVVQDDTEN